MGYKYVEIEKDGARGSVLPQALKVWEKNGWTVVEDGGESKAVETTNPEKTEQVEVTPDLPIETEPTEGDTEGEDQ